MSKLEPSEFSKSVASVTSTLEETCGFPRTLKPAEFSIQIGSSEIFAIDTGVNDITACQLDLDMSLQLGPLLALLRPLLCAVQVGVGLYDVVKSVPDVVKDTIAGDLDAFDNMKETMVALREAAECIASFMPEFALPKFILGVMKMILVKLVCARDQLIKAQAMAVSAKELKDSIKDIDPEDTGRIAFAVATAACQDQGADLAKGTVLVGLIAITSTIVAIDELAEMLGLDLIPDRMTDLLNSMGEGSLDSLIETLQDAIDLFISIIEAVPFPLVPPQDLSWAKHPA